MMLSVWLAVGVRFTFSHSVMDDVIVHMQSLGPEDTDGWRKAVMEGTALNVWLVGGNLEHRKENDHFYKWQTTTSESCELLFFFFLTIWTKVFCESFQAKN